MIHAGRRRLNPSQPSGRHRRVPRHGHLGMAAEDVGGRQLGGDALLPRIDDLPARRSGGDLIEMTPLDGVAKHDTHEAGSNRKTTVNASRLTLANLPAVRKVAYGAFDAVSNWNRTFR